MFDESLPRRHFFSSGGRPSESNDELMSVMTGQKQKKKNRLVYHTQFPICIRKPRPIS